MKKVQKYFYCFLSILCLCILKFSLSGCSEIKDGIVGTSAGGGKPEGEAPKTDVSITTERTKQIGDVCELRTMSDNDFDTSTVRWKCIVQKAKLYDKPSDAGIDTSRIITSEYYKSPEMPVCIDASVAANSMMLLCDIEIENLNDFENLNITSLDLVSKDSKGEAQQVGLPNYFSHGGTEDAKYYDFTLTKGSKETVQVGWYIDSNDLDKDSLYLAIGLGTALKDQTSLATYVNLNL